jgi:hypothetical protein
MKNYWLNTRVHHVALVKSTTTSGIVMTNDEDFRVVFHNGNTFLISEPVGDISCWTREEAMNGRENIGSLEDRLDQRYVAEYFAFRYFAKRGEKVPEFYEKQLKRGVVDEWCDENSYSDRKAINERYGFS